VAIGKPHFINEKHVREGQIVIDVGISKDLQGTLVGDVDFAKVEPIVSMISPVPGGVGPMTVLSLFENLLDLSRRSEI
jgi:methylenetetrahydrofolate dehydrogenase (NADP+)/methenyltetrahydrofolate cyclohydrolase